MKKTHLFAVTVLLSILAHAFVALAMPPFDPAKVPAAPDYARPESWLHKPAAPKAKVDVFFVYPTVLFNDTDWIMNTADPEMKNAARSPLLTQASVFKGQANIYAPMYRQMNLAVLSLPDDQAALIKKVGREDVWRAFLYYLKHENQGRPFFLAGHSQGSMVLADLMIQHWGSTGVEKRLIAALLIGWSITPENLTQNPALKLCERKDATGCIISYNTMENGKQKKAPTLLPGALAVNPLSWDTGKELVPASKNLGAVFFDAQNQPTTHPGFTSAQIIDGGLIVKPQNVDLVTVKGGHFPAGVYHAFDYSLFYENLKANLADRINAMNK